MIRLRFMYGVVVNKISYCIYTVRAFCLVADFVWASQLHPLSRFFFPI